MRLRPFAPALALCLVLGARSARADDPAAAQALFNDAKALAQAGKYAEACPKFEESQRMAPGIGTRFNLADCYEHVGRTASAWANFLGVAAAAKAAGQAEREAAARDRATRLEPRLSRLAVVVPEAARSNGLEVKRDDEAIGQAQWGEALPVDPGAHTIVASAPGKRAYRADVEVVGDGSTARVAIPALDDAATAVTTVAAPAPTSAPATTDCPSPAGPSTPPEHTIKPVAWGLVVGGGAAIAAGVVFLVLRGHEASTLDGECGEGGHACPPSAANDIATGKMYSGISVTLFGVGALAAAAGAGILLFGGDHASASRPSARLVPLTTANAGGLAVHGAF